MGEVGTCDSSYTKMGDVQMLEQRAVHARVRRVQERETDGNSLTWGRSDKEGPRADTGVARAWSKSG